MSMHEDTKKKLQEDWNAMWKARRALILSLQNEENEVIKKLVSTLISAHGYMTADALATAMCAIGSPLSAAEVQGNLMMFPHITIRNQAEPDEDDFRYYHHRPGRSRHGCILEMENCGWVLVEKVIDRRRKMMEVDENGLPIPGTVKLVRVVTTSYKLVQREPGEIRGWRH